MKLRNIVLAIFALAIVFFRLPISKADILNHVIITDISKPYDVATEPIPEGSNLIIGPGVTITSSDINVRTINLHSINTMPGSTITISKIDLIIDPGEDDTPSLISNSDISGSITIKSGSVNITQNHLSSPTINPAINITDAVDFSISKNIIDNSDIGLTVTKTDKGLVEFNTINNNGIGVQLFTANAKIIHNNIFSNLKERLPIDDQSNFGLQIDKSVPIESPIDVSENWWGCDLGPKFNPLQVSSCELISSLNDNIVFTPWLHGLAMFNLKPGDIIITEIFPNPPVTSEWLKEQPREWVEIRSNLNYPITVFSLELRDLTLSRTIVDRVNLPANGYAVVVANKNGFKSLGFDFSNEQIFEISQIVNPYIGSGLNNSSETICLLYSQSQDGSCNSIPNSSVINSVSYEKTEENKSISFFPINPFPVITTPTPGEENKKPETIVPPPIITPPIIPPPVLTCPGSIKIKDLINHINCYVEITAKVKRSYGTYFYIYDDTGETKVYLQASKKIKKPRLTAGVQVKVRGIIDNYKTGLRILPQKTGDVTIILGTISSSKKSTKSNKTATQSKVVPPASSTAQSAPEQLTPSSVIAAIDDIIPPVHASVKGTQSVKTLPISSHITLKITLLSAIILLIALASYNLGISHGKAKP